MSGTIGRSTQPNPAVAAEAARLGREAQRGGRFEVAREQYRRALDAGSDDPAIAYNLGVTIEALNAEELSALRGQPGTTPPADPRSAAERVRGRLDEAVDAFELATRLQHDDPSTHLRFASALLERTSFDTGMGRLGALGVQPTPAGLKVRSSLLGELEASRAALATAAEVALRAAPETGVPRDALATASQAVRDRIQVEHILTAGAITAGAIAAFSDNVTVPNMRAGILASFGAQDGASLRRELGVAAVPWLNAWTKWFIEETRPYRDSPEARQQLAATATFIGAIATSTLNDVAPK